MESTITAKLATNSSEILGVYQLLKPSYWFITPEALSLDKLILLEILVTLVFGISLLLIAFRFLNRSLTPPENKFVSKIILYTIWFGPIGWFLIIFRSWGVVFLSARFFWVLWFLGLVLLVFYLFKSYNSTVQSSKQTYFSYQLKKKYFPKKRKKK